MSELPDKPEYACPECGCEEWRWNEYANWVGWECSDGCVMVWAE